MGVLVFIETENGLPKGSSLEAVSFGKKISEGEVVGLCLGSLDGSGADMIGKAGAAIVLHDANSEYDKGLIAPTSSAVFAAMESTGSNYAVFAKGSLSDAVAARVSIKANASLASNLISVPTKSGDGFKVQRSIFTGKAIEEAEVKGGKVIFSIKKGAVELSSDGSPATIESTSYALNEADLKVNVLGSHKAEGDVLLPEADIVVSGGRGMKGPENWGMVEDLARELSAATGCSKPVSDMGWRPHHEHVGQTGVKVSPNLYVAIGISGAIQHLAGVNSSKVIVVINKDPEAPFFKAADYGIVGDAFEIVPKFTDALKGAN